MKTVGVRTTGGRYDVLVGRGLLAGLGEAQVRRSPGGQVVVITDDNVAPLYLEALTSSMRVGGRRRVAGRHPGRRAAEEPRTGGGALRRAVRPRTAPLRHGRRSRRWRHRRSRRVRRRDVPAWRAAGAGADDAARAGRRVGRRQGGGRLPRRQELRRHVLSARARRRRPRRAAHAAAPRAAQRRRRGGQVRSARRRPVAPPRRAVRRRGRDRAGGQPRSLSPGTSPSRWRWSARTSARSAGAAPC